MAEIVMGILSSLSPILMFFLIFGLWCKAGQRQWEEQCAEYDASGGRTPLTGTTSSNAGDYWASDYGDDGGFGE